MNKKYFSNNIIREARPRSKRLRDLGVSGSATALGSNIVSVSSVGVSSGGESHSHENKSYLDEITTSADGYLSLTKLKESEDGLQYNSVTEKVKSGYADKSAHSVEADHSKESDYAQKADYSKESGNAEKWDNNIFDDYLDQPLRSKDDVTFNIVISNVINAIEKITTEILNADNINVSNKIKTALAEITTKLSAKLIEAENIDVSDTITAFIADVITLYAQEADVNNLKAITANISESLKVKNQTVTGQISSLNYAEALLGWFIKQDGTAQLKGLKLLEFLDVPELRYNRVTVLAGESWRGPGAGLIESVDTENQIIYLKLVDGDKRTADIDDICKGIFHHAGGFQTVFFRPTEMVGETAFKYSLRPGTTLHPSAMMNFISYGNFTNTDRQKSVQETTSYKRYLANVNTWDISSSMIMMQLGDLSGLQINGVAMDGYSAFLNKIFMVGTIKQLSSSGTEVNVAIIMGEWQEGSYGYYEQVTYNGSSWLCVSETGTSSTPGVSGDWLEISAKGKDAIVCEVQTSHGNVFQNGRGTTNLTCIVRKGENDITDSIPANRFSWERSSSNSDTDTIFNQQHNGFGNTLEVTSDMVYGRAQFSCIVNI